MTSSEKILAGIAEESKAQADKINSDAEKQAADIIAAAREEAESEAEKIKAEAEKKAELIINSGKSSAELLKRDTALKCRRGLIEKALITVADTVNAYSDKDYFDFLLTLIKKEKLNGKGEVYLSVKDKARDTAAFKSELSALDLTLSDTFADINGGFILKYGDIQINGELSALIHEKRDVLTDELNKALFN
jgi:V/A-type H+-transporting ATPase subunit E